MVKVRRLVMKSLPMAAVLAGIAVIALIDRNAGSRAVSESLYGLKELLLVIPPIFVLLGLLDAWVPREKIIRFMGDDSGLTGVLLAFLLGSASAGPLYAAFPMAQVLLKKGASMRIVLVLLGAASTTKIPMLMFELANMGLRFTATRLAVDIVGILAMALLIDRLLPKADKSEIYLKAEV